MDIFSILIAGFVATSVMTFFSYVYSNMKHKQFREPELLNSLISRSEILKLNPSKNSLIGWLMHYAIGWIFVALFSMVWEYTPFVAGWISGLVLGFIAGIAGIMGWISMFKVNNNPPEIDFGQFYFQLLIAHVLFGIAAALVYAYAVQ